MNVIELCVANELCVILAYLKKTDGGSAYNTCQLNYHNLKK